MRCALFDSRCRKSVVWSAAKVGGQVGAKLAPTSEKLGLKMMSKKLIQNSHVVNDGKLWFGPLKNYQPTTHSAIPNDHDQGPGTRDHGPGIIGNT